MRTVTPLSLPIDNQLAVRPALSKVPQVTVLFWVIKVLTTGMGETTSDFLAHTIDPIVAVGLAGIALAVAFVLQFSAGRYVAWRYWLTVVMVSVFGTMVADGLHVQLGVPYAVSASFFVVVLAVVLLSWYASEKTLSIHSVHTLRREIFYWVTVMTTFALGTAVGDLTATTLHLGYFGSGVLFAAVMLIPVVGHWKLRWNAVFAFWFAYIVTRPLGASFADWLGVPAARGGADVGTGLVSLVLGLVIVALVGYLTVTRSDETARQPGW
jgi:uncharacterized membrane-anchored protein